VATAAQGVAVGSQTLPVEGSATIDGITQSSATLSSTPMQEATFTLADGHSYIVVQGGSLTIGSQTLSAGGSAATLGTQVVSLASDGVVLMPAESALTSEASTTLQAVITLGSEMLTAIYTSEESGAVYVVDGTTLTVGGAGATIEGQAVSAATGGIVVGGSQTASRTTVTNARFSESTGSFVRTAELPRSSPNASASGAVLPFSSAPMLQSLGMVQKMLEVLALGIGVLVVML